MPRQVIVHAASRLHFGLFALAARSPAAAERSYGGVGVMVDRPGLELHVAATTQPGLEIVADSLAERINTFAGRWSEFYSRPFQGLRISLLNPTPDHIGLGTGTQLGLAVAAGLGTFHGWPVPPVEELARSVGRGARSAVGAYGFALGGLIVDRGKLPGEFLAPLDCRLALPAAWRFVLVRPQSGAGLAGEREQQAMDHANRNLGPLTEQLVAEARERLLPAAAQQNFADFAASLGRYCELAGQFYTDVQGGPYNGPVVAALAQRIRDLGHRGMGQSSWGPTLFVVCEHEVAAQELAAKLAAGATAHDRPEITIAAVFNEPARIEVND